MSGVWTDICKMGQNHLLWESIHRAGRAGGSWWNKPAGATKYLCMPNNPDYLQYDSTNQGHNYVYGVEYDIAPGQPLHTNPNVDQHNAPCSVCMAVSRCSLLMVPDKTSCPISWTREYYGYLMSAHQNQTFPTTYAKALPIIDVLGYDGQNSSFSSSSSSFSSSSPPPHSDSTLIAQKGSHIST